jgi:hypothetical protein
VNNSPGTWAAAPAPLQVSVRAGEGAGGSDRVEIVWAAGAIVDRWLQVIVEGNDAAGGFNANTGLTASDVFYYGNQVGDTFLGVSAGFSSTDASDQVQSRMNQGLALSTANVFDFNRDALVDATDQLITRMNQGFLISINISEPSGGPLAAPAVVAESLAPVEPVTFDEPAAVADVVAVDERASALLKNFSPAEPAADRPRGFDSTLANAAAREHWRLYLLASLAQDSWAGQVDDDLMGLLVDGRLWSRRR